MGAYQTRPALVDAQQWDGSSEVADQLLGWVAESGHGQAAYRDAGVYWTEFGTQESGPAQIVISSIGTTFVRASDWIVHTPAGMFFALSDEQFTAGYEPVPQETP